MVSIRFNLLLILIINKFYKLTIIRLNMRIAFVGKGGSGKSTIASFFVNHLVNEKIPQVVIDADINMHLSFLLGIKHDKSKSISLPQNSNEIRKYLRGNNNNINSPTDFVKTTPPGTGSNFLDISSDNFILKNFSTKISENSYFLDVGTYESVGIGTSCYHGNLSVLENVLTHSLEKEDEFVVVDMVAGTDAFSNSLHLLFDAIVFVLEPTPESVKVYEKYIELSNHSGVKENIFVLLNKFEDEDDISFVESKGIKIDFKVPYSKFIKKRLQNINDGTSINAGYENFNDSILSDIKAQMESIKKETKNVMKDRNSLLKKIFELHKKYISQNYIVKTLGDLNSQIDLNFEFPKK